MNTARIERSQRRLGKGTRRVIIVLSVFLLFGMTVAPSHAYSVLAHEALIDAVWEPAIRPVLLQHYPGLTREQLEMARSYAYGGSLIQDMGYYPFGSHFFTDLLHYVRSGDFIAALLRDQQNANELAFALGAASHFFADTVGHPVAVNRSVPMRFPKLRRKYGDSVTYAEGKRQHLNVEFSFDVLQVAGGAYAPQAYHDFIGFRVSKPLLERAFHDVYGLQLNQVLKHEDLSVGSYRYTISTLIPKATRIAWAQKQDQIARTKPGLQRSGFIYLFPRRKYETEFGTDYRAPGFGAHVLAFFLRILPKIGPLSALAFKPPNAEMERYFKESFRDAETEYGAFVRRIRDNGASALPDRDFDTGRSTVRGEYSLADDTYAELLDKLAARHFQDVPSAMSADLLRFYAQPAGEDQASRKESKRRQKTERELADLKTVSASLR